MVVFEIKVHPKQRLAYIPKELFEVLGCKVKALSKGKAVFLYPEGMPTQYLLKSLDIIRRELELMNELEIGKEIPPTYLKEREKLSKQALERIKL